MSMVIKEVVAAGIMIIGVREPIKTKISRHQDTLLFKGIIPNFPYKRLKEINFNSLKPRNSQNIYNQHD